MRCYVMIHVCVGYEWMSYDARYIYTLAHVSPNLLRLEGISRVDQTLALTRKNNRRGLVEPIPTLYYFPRHSKINERVFIRQVRFTLLTKD
jgi:hypothetical protein